MSLSSFVGHVRATLSAWWAKWDPSQTVKHATDTINSFGLTEEHLEDIATEIILIKDSPLKGIEKALHVAKVIDTWTDGKSLPAQAMDSLHVVISLVHLIAKLTGKI